MVKKKRNFKNIFMKILCGEIIPLGILKVKILMGQDQAFAAPINCSMFLFVMTLLRSGSVYEGIETVRNVSHLAQCTQRSSSCKAEILGVEICGLAPLAPRWIIQLLICACR